MKKTQVLMFRQGDVFLKRVSSVPTDALKKDEEKSRIVARGEWSDHSHVATGDATIYEKDGKMYVTVGKKGAKLQHTLESQLNFKNLSSDRDLQVADHGILELPPQTTFEVVIQNEFNPFAAMFERVKD